MSDIFDIIAKISWDSNPKELQQTIDLSRQQGRMLDELRAKGGRLEQQIAKTNDPAKLKKYNDQLQETRKRADAITEAQKKQAASVDVLKKKQQELIDKLRTTNDPKIVQGLIRNLHQVENQLTVINRQATTLPSKLGGVGSSLLSGFTGGLAGGGLIGAVQLASSAISELFSDSIDQAAEAEQGLLKFKQTLDNLGKGQYFDELVDNADNLAKAYKNLFDNDDILAGQAKFIEGTRVNKQQLQQLIPVAIELAAKLGTDVTSASEMLVNSIIGKTSPELKRLGLNMKGVGTQTERVNLITGDFAKLLSGSVDTALQTTSGQLKQLNQELDNQKEILGNRLMPVYKGFLSGLNELLDADFKSFYLRFQTFGLVTNDENKRLLQNMQAQAQAGVNLRTANVQNIAATQNMLRSLGAQNKAFENATSGMIKYLEVLKKRKQEEDKTAFNPNAGADDEADKPKGETAEQRAERLKREQEASDKIIKDAKLSLLDEEAREIAVREQKYEEDKKKLRKVSAADRLAFEKAYQQDLQDIHDKYEKQRKAKLSKIRIDAYDAEVAYLASLYNANKAHLERMSKLADLDEKEQKDRASKSIENKQKSDQDNADAQQQLKDNAFELISIGQRALELETSRTDKQIRLQEDRVEAARKSSTASVKIEEDRLNNLLAKRRKFEQAQRAIDAATIVANQAVAISGAVKTISTSGNPVLIAANVIAIAAGIAASTLAVRNAFADTGFKEGGYTGDGDPNQVSKAQGNRGYKYHKKEFVMNEELTSKHRRMFEALHKGELGVKQIGDSYYLGPSIDVDRAVSDANNVRTLSSPELSAMAYELANIKMLLENRELYVQNNLDEDGFSQRIVGNLNNITLKNLMRKQ